MKFLIRIDKSTIKENPYAGQSVVEQCVGNEIVRDGDGKIVSIRMQRQQLHLLSPEPKYLFKYEPTQVECGSCHQKFSWEELLTDSWDDDIVSYTICPQCGEWNCCEIEYEKLPSDWRIVC